MKKFRRFEIWMALILIVLLTIMSIVGAFYGAEKATRFFNSVPLTVYWLVLVVLLLAGIATFHRLIRVSGLLWIHLGCVFILVGGIWGSDEGHRLGKKYFGIDKVPSGYMLIHEQTAEKNITDEEDKVIAELPFSIFLEDFRIEYYKGKSYLQVENRKGGRWQLSDDVNTELVLDEGKITILRVLRNFQITIAEGKKEVTDSLGPANNPAVEINVELPDGTSKKEYIFARYPQESYSDSGLKFIYVQQQDAGIKDYFSDVVIREGEKQVAKKTIEVNHPMYYRGYHFYQSSYDSRHGKYTVLSVSSDSGLYLVYAGYLMLSIAILWHFWFRHIVRYFNRSVNDD